MQRPSPKTRPDLRLLWSGRRDLNPRPSPWQGDALPTELRPHVVQINYSGALHGLLPSGGANRPDSDATGAASRTPSAWRRPSPRRSGPPRPGPGGIGADDGDRLQPPWRCRPVHRETRRRAPPPRPGGHGDRRRPDRPPSVPAPARSAREPRPVDRAGAGPTDQGRPAGEKARSAVGGAAPAPRSALATPGRRATARLTGATPMAPAAPPDRSMGRDRAPMQHPVPRVPVGRVHRPAPS